MADTFKGIITADGKKRQLPYGSVLETPVSNKTLDVEGAFADAKVVGDNFKKAKAETDSLKGDLDYIYNLSEDVTGYPFLNFEYGFRINTFEPQQTNTMVAKTTIFDITNIHEELLFKRVPTQYKVVVFIILFDENKNVLTFSEWDEIKENSLASRTGEYYKNIFPNAKYLSITYCYTDDGTSSTRHEINNMNELYIGNGHDNINNRLKVFDKLGITKFIVVDIAGKGDYISVAEAVKNSAEGTTIIVKPGIYDGTIRAFNKRVNIIGTDREKCIIRSTNGLYANPAMECCCGYLENITFKSEYIEGISQEIGTQSGAYAVHCENNGNDGLAVGDSLTFVNCNLSSDFCPALGVGAFRDWSLNLINCRLTTNQPLNRGVYTNEGSLGALYFHDMNGEKGTAHIKVKDCIIENTQLANTICPYDLGQGGVNIQCEFINNTIYSAVNGFTDSIWWRGGQGSFGGNFHLSPLSNGNTGNEFNN